MGPGHFFFELRRRKVCRATFAYWVVAWTCIEVSAVIEQALSLPAWLDHVVVLLSLAGLPVVIVCSWLFDLSPAGLVLDSRQEASPEPSSHEALVHSIANEVCLKLRNELVERR